MADVAAQVAAQRSELAAAVKRLPDLVREIQSAATVDAYRDLVETSPVRTGAYRAEHVIEQGDGSILHESANRPGPDAVVNPPILLDAPTIPASVTAGDFAVVQIANRRFYAAQLEYGSASSAPRYIYTQAEERARVNVERLVREVR
jgi:hypothetical protein